MDPRPPKSRSNFTGSHSLEKVMRLHSGRYGARAWNFHIKLGDGGSLRRIFRRKWWKIRFFTIFARWERLSPSVWVCTCVGACGGVQGCVRARECVRARGCGCPCGGFFQILGTLTPTHTHAPTHVHMLPPHSVDQCPGMINDMAPNPRGPNHARRTLRLRMHAEILTRSVRPR